MLHCMLHCTQQFESQSVLELQILENSVVSEISERSESNIFNSATLVTTVQVVKKIQTMPENQNRQRWKNTKINIEKVSKSGNQQICKKKAMHSKIKNIK